MPEVDGPILLDTHVVSLLMKGHLGPAVSGLDRYRWCVSDITVGELAKGIAIAGWGRRWWTDLAEWLRHVAILSCDLRVSDTWGQLHDFVERER